MPLYLGGSVKEESAMSVRNVNPLRDLVSPPLATSVDTGIDKMLHAVREHLGMDVAFLAEFRAKDRIFRHVDAKAAAPIQAGDTLSLDQGYCQRVVDGRLPQLIKDAGALPAAAALPETSAVPIGSHLSVPIFLGDGRIYGTLCCFSFVPDVSLTERDLQIMKVLAELLADQIDQQLQAVQLQAQRVEELTALMDAGEPSMLYQPIYDLESRRIAGVEALARFRAPPQVAPDVWFNEASALGIGPKLEACAVRSALTALGTLPKDVYVAVNASPEFVLSGALPELLQSADISRVVLELTEHASVTDYRELTDVLAPLRALGLRIAIDDAGAGYASMRHILSIEPNLVKLDISLTRGIDRDRKRRALASALIAFARETDVGIIAEGVETSAELLTLQSLGVKRAQGYYLARPKPLAEIPGAMTMPSPAAERYSGKRLDRSMAGDAHRPRE
jgi:EAL domain-containing protein (putative c-di-GMP-specific phosphodiesterase class I)